ncbi:MULTISPECIES: CDP-alcohol phosphatidyltransferase family protein [unclassified Caulobacter]|uniref:CDP-alcohol phosphatidyltransferase family protein n=1 Tax=unclassified Caulobacter TaxID=2648921 RepID=UPI000783C1B5|nr:MULTISPECIES: CDP-alcohol phosphatidyltransferase family protein [unclassified Caulobacter]AZS20789.1 CDP-alcohol phosphatidyltransferase family protein [Caulobacter sp. FWC26]
MSGEIQNGPRALTVGRSDARIWGMSSAERLSRIYRRLDLVETPAVDLSHAVVAVDAGWVFDESLIKALAGREGAVLVDDGGRAVAVHAPADLAYAASEALANGRDPSGLDPRFTRLTALELGSAYNSALRKREPPVLERLTPETVRAVEKRLFQGSYKGVTDFVTKYVWPTPARIVTRWCALAKMTPNQVTFIGFLLVLAATWLFWQGQFGWGLVCAWIMTFLDTVDGKLARVTLTSSKWGNVFDHGIDLLHPPFWWWAWFVGVYAVGQEIPYAALSLAIVVGGYVAQRVEEGIFLALFKLEMHAWRPFDSFFRLITARRNPNLILLTGCAMVGRPDVGFTLVAIWTALCFLVHAVQIVQGLAAPRGSIQSWLSK